MLILGLESSCDETAASVVSEGREILSNIVASQIDIHREYGGVVPEIASRKHVESISHVVSDAIEGAGVTLNEIEGIAVTRGPGLIGSLVVGLSMAKALAFALGIPFVGVNHIEGHIAAVFLTDRRPAFPFIALVVSGGHTHIYEVRDFGDISIIGQTRDDAAGEAFDKAAKMLGLGYPGGVVIDRLAKNGDPRSIAFPRPMKNSQDFSFSGVKTALFYYLRKKEGVVADNEVHDIVASYQDAIVDVLVDKTFRAAKEAGIPRIVVSGGVAANSRLRERFSETADVKGVDLFIPPSHLCTDNAAMIAVVGDRLLAKGCSDSLAVKAVSRWPLDAKGVACTI